MSRTPLLKLPLGLGVSLPMPAMELSGGFWVVALPLMFGPNYLEGMKKRKKTIRKALGILPSERAF